MRRFLQWFFNPDCSCAELRAPVRLSGGRVAMVPREVVAQLAVRGKDVEDVEDGETARQRKSEERRGA